MRKPSNINRKTRDTVNGDLSVLLTILSGTVILSISFLLYIRGSKAYGESARVTRRCRKSEKSDSWTLAGVGRRIPLGGFEGISEGSTFRARRYGSRDGCDILS
jgi:hypothetical protein